MKRNERIRDRAGGRWMKWQMGRDIVSERCDGERDEEGKRERSKYFSRYSSV